MKRLAQLAALVLAPACGVTDPTADINVVHETRLVGNLTIKFRALVASSNVEVFADVLNLGAIAGRMEYGSCSFVVRGKGAFGDMWDSSPPPGTGCTDPLFVLDVGPAEQQSRRVYVASLAILRQQVPPGPYDVTVYIRLDGKLQSFFAGQIQLPNPSP